MKRPRRTTPRCDALTEAVHRLAIPEDRRFRIEAAVYSFDVVCGDIFADADSPNKRIAGSARSAGALAKLETSASYLAHLLAKLPLEAVEVLDAAIAAETDRRLAAAVIISPPLFERYNLPPVHLFQQKLSRLAECARVATVLLSASSSPRGRHRNQRALMVARVAAWHFEALTGCAPTRQTKVVAVNEHLQGSAPSGAFQTFLKDVFAALEIKGSAEAMAKAVLMEKKTVEAGH